MKPSDLGLPARFDKFRSYPGFDQLACALDLATAPERFQILNAATGSGKSVTYSASAALRNPDARYLVLVGTKGLQTQLLDDGLVQRRVWGHRNYPCIPRGGFGLDDADTDDSDFRCMVPRDRCQYAADVEAARNAKSVVANNAYWLSIGRYGDPTLLREFDYLVIDEGHQMPGWLAGSLAITMSSSRIRRVLQRSWPRTLPTLTNDWHEWASETLDVALAVASKTGKTDPGRRRLERLGVDLRMLKRVTDGWDDDRKLVSRNMEFTEPWITTIAENRESATFTPRWGVDFAEKYLFRGIPHVLLTSATVTPQHAKYLGIPESEMRYREVPSPFDPRRRPVVWIPTARQGYDMSDGSKYRIGRRVDELIEAAIEQQAGNGIIHTGSYARNREIVAGSKFAAAIITHRQDSADFQAAMSRYLDCCRRGQFAVFASPRIQEGVDLSDELGRWGIVLKVPYPYSVDPLTQARAKDPGYRDLVVAETMIQMCGRLVRSEWDFGTIVIIDDHWEHQQRQSPFASWFRAAFRTERLASGRDFKFLNAAIVDSFPKARQITLIGA